MSLRGMVFDWFFAPVKQKANELWNTTTGAAADVYKQAEGMVVATPEERKEKISERYQRNMAPIIERQKARKALMAAREGKSDDDISQVKSEIQSHIDRLNRQLQELSQARLAYFYGKSITEKRHERDGMQNLLKAINLEELKLAAQAELSKLGTNASSTAEFYMKIIAAEKVADLTFQPEPDPLTL